MKQIRKFSIPHADRGAGMIEYGILAGLISIVSIGAVAGLGDRVSTIFFDTAEVMPGATPSFSGSGGDTVSTPEIAAAGDWTWDGSTGMSTNTDDNSSSALDLTIPLAEGDMLAFTYEVSSEYKFDLLTLTTPEGFMFTASGERTATYYYRPTYTGDHVITWDYTKDVSNGGGLDRALVRDLVYTPASEMPSIPNVSVGGQWNYNGIVAESVNSAPNSTSTMDMTVTASAGDVITFDYQVSSELGWDLLTMSTPEGPALSTSGSRSSSYYYHVPSSGNHTFTWAYSKDESADVGDDMGRVLGVDITPASQVGSLAGVVVTGDWSWNGTRGESTNTADNSSSEMVMVVPMLAGDTFHFNYEVSSEPIHDVMKVTTPDGPLATISGRDSRDASYTASADGDYTFTFRYEKDSSINKHDDKGAVSNFVLFRG